MNVLFLARWFPYPANHGAKIRTFNVIKQLASRHSVTLIAFSDAETTADHIDAMRRWTPRIESVPYRAFRPGGARALAGFFGRRPRSITDTHSAEVEARVRKLAVETQFDVVVASGLDMALYALAVPGVPRLLEEIEIGNIQNLMLSEPRVIARWRKAQTWQKWRRFTVEMLTQFQAATAVSETEQALIRNAALTLAPRAASRIHVLTNGADLKQLTGHFADAIPNRIVYSGALTYYVNYDAMQWFLGDIWPLVRAGRPDAEIHMCGGQRGVDMDALPKPDGARHVGYLADIRPFVQSGAVLVVPERLGGGTRIKVLEAMALGTPVVANSNSINGLHVTPGENVLVGDTPRQIADALIRVMEDASLRAKLSAQGRALIEERYSWEVVGARLNALLDDIVAAPRRTA
jgi:glycosyltransferase involved in cell wall biosynthesis